MHLEVQVALNFVISYLYNKLPRRRVNLFGEELEKALKEKFRGHWYPEKPMKGSAFRCLKTGDPGVDTVFERAARESGVPIQDILENLPQDLAVWVDPGEVSYRIGEKGTMKILYNEQSDLHEEASADREIIKTFNPEAQCFRPIDAVLGALSLSSPKGSPPLPPDVSPTSAPGFKGPGSSPSPVTPSTTFIPRSTAPLTFTTATFAQTKFGSTKLKTNSKRANRMSPTEFSNYIKQRAMQQQATGGPVSGGGPVNGSGSHGSPGGRSLSPPQDLMYPTYYRPTSAATLFDGPPGSAPSNSGAPTGGPPGAPGYHGVAAAAAAAAAAADGLYHHHKLTPFLEPTHQFYPMPASTPPAGPGVASEVGSGLSPKTQQQSQQQQQLIESLSNFTNYSPNQYQHLLVAN